ncbi:hypothetical protein P7C70_g8735, partial [Phenoliferia sp. Uapishka_3]
MAFNLLRSSSRTLLSPSFSSLSSPKSTSLLFNATKRHLSSEARAKIEGVRPSPLSTFTPSSYTDERFLCGGNAGNESGPSSTLYEGHPGLAPIYNCLEDSELREGIKEFSRRGDKKMEEMAIRGWRWNGTQVDGMGDIDWASKDGMALLSDLSRAPDMRTSPQARTPIAFSTSAIFLPPSPSKLFSKHKLHRR